MKISEIQDIRIASYDYPLPDERIARHPLAQRDTCKLLLSRSDGKLGHFKFRDLANLMPFDGLMVCNNTRVINARIRFHKESGAKIEVFLLEPHEPNDYVIAFQEHKRCRWICMIGNLKRWKDEYLTKELIIDGHNVELRARRICQQPGNSWIVEFEWDTPKESNPISWASIVDAAGYIPIPPYLRRESEECDSDDYQTVYSKIKGSVAAPTAGLHFTPGVLADIESHNTEIQNVTLHVGAGTFQPVKSETIGEHPMHTETFTVTLQLVDSLINTIKEGRKITAVGTTSVRTLESLPYLGHNLSKNDHSLRVQQWEAYSDDSNFDTLQALQSLLNFMKAQGQTSLTASTAIMIAPGFNWRIVDVMVTNFHQPQSTLLLLVSSFLDGEKIDNQNLQWKHIYDEALNNGYRFLSYGDACLLFPTDDSNRIK